MSKLIVCLALLFSVATVFVAGPVSAFSDSSCSTLFASAAFSSALSLPAASSVQFAKVREAISQGHFDLAANLLNSAPLGAEQSLWRGVLLLHSGKTFASIRSLEEASHFQNSSMIDTLLAVDYLLLNQRQLTQRSIKRALALEPGNKAALYLRGRFWFVTHNFSRATEDFRAVLAAEPDDYRSLFYLGYSQWRLGRTDEASRYLRRSVNVIQCKQINFAIAPESLAQVEFENGDLDKALVNSGLALDMAAQSKEREENLDRASNILLFRGKIYLALGKQKEAIEDWHRALGLDPDLAECWYLLAHLYRQRGERNQADKALTRFKALHEEL